MQMSERQVYLETTKVRIHQQLVERLDVQNLRTVPQDQVRAEVRSVIKDLYQLEKGLLTSSEQERLMDEVMDETFGLGPLEAMFKDPTITDILINRVGLCRARGLARAGRCAFRDDNHRGRSSSSSPRWPAHRRNLPDGRCPSSGWKPMPLFPAGRRWIDHVNPLASPLQLEICCGTRHAPMIDFLARRRARGAMCSSAAAPAQAKPRLNCLSRYIPQRAIITIEDAADAASAAARRTTGNAAAQHRRPRG
jgi:pilus assembly protein CpaF